MKIIRGADNSTKSLEGVLNELGIYPVNFSEAELSNVEQVMKNFKERLRKLIKIMSTRKFKRKEAWAEGKATSFDVTYIRREDFLPDIDDEEENEAGEEEEENEAGEEEEEKGAGEEEEENGAGEEEEENGAGEDEELQEQEAGGDHLEEDVDEDDVEQVVGQKYRKPLDQLACKKQRSARTETVYNDVIQAAEDNQINFSQMCGHLLQRFYHMSDKKVGSFGGTLFRQVNLTNIVV